MLHHHLICRLNSISIPYQQGLTSSRNIFLGNEDLSPVEKPPFTMTESYQRAVSTLLSFFFFGLLFDEKVRLVNIVDVSGVFWNV